MTFYEAALRVLEAAGGPLNFQEITERSIQENLLSHVGKTPEMTMLSRLLAMARRKTDRKVVVTSKDTFALADWALPEEPDALAQTAASEIREEDNLPPLRPAERHPEPRPENVRVAGRSADRKRWRDEEDGKRKKRKFPPASEVVFEILSDEDSSLKAAAIIERARERELVAEDVTEQQVLTALLEDNQRRIDAGRRPQFRFDQDSGEIALEKAGAPSEIAPVELQAAFAAALGIPMEGGRPVLPKAAGAAAEVPADLQAAQAALKTAAKEARRATARALRRRLADLEAGTFEKAAVKVLHALGFRELKVAKRSKEGPLLTARKRDGNLELRYAIRLLKGNAGADRRAVQELRRDVGHHSAQVALLVTAGEARGEAKSEAISGGALVFLWCGEALAEKFIEAHAGVSVTTVESYELDERFFDAARVDAEESARRREERQRDKKERPSKREREPREPTEEREEPAAAAEAAPSEFGEEAGAEELIAETPARVEAPTRAEEELEEGEEGAEGDEDELEEAEAFVAGGRAEEGAEGQPEERRRRRRRRRGRRGRGQKAQEGAAAAGAAAPEAEGAEAAPGAPVAEGGGAEPSEPTPVEAGEVRAPVEAALAAPVEATPPPPPAAPPPPASTGSGEGSGD